MRRHVHKFDSTVIHQVRKLPLWVRPMMQFATLIGQPPFTVGVAAAIIGYGFARDNTSLVILGSIAIITLLISSILKILLRRARPVNDYVKNMIIHTFSFPSGHAAGSLVSFGLVAFLLELQFSWGYIAGVLIYAFCFLIGISRIYLGAHYPSDVIGGWIVGGAGLMAIALVGI